MATPFESDKQVTSSPFQGITVTIAAYTKPEIHDGTAPATQKQKSSMRMSGLLRQLTAFIIA